MVSSLAKVWWQSSMGSNFIRLHRNYHPVGLPPAGRVPGFGCLSSPLRPAECQQTKRKKGDKHYWTWRKIHVSSKEIRQNLYVVVSHDWNIEASWETAGPTQDHNAHWWKSYCSCEGSSSSTTENPALLMPGPEEPKKPKVHWLQ